MARRLEKGETTMTGQELKYKDVELLCLYVKLKNGKYYWCDNIEELVEVANRLGYSMQLLDLPLENMTTAPLIERNEE